MNFLPSIPHPTSGSSDDRPILVIDSANVFSKSLIFSAAAPYRGCHKYHRITRRWSHLCSLACYY